MRRTSAELEAFYASPLGGAVREAVNRRLRETWGDARGDDVLALGFATPFAEGLAHVRRVVAAMPAGQGVATWPAGAKNAVALAEEAALPFPSAFFDRLLMVHALEESEAPREVLGEAARVLNAAGRLIVVAAARNGPWAWSEATPFGHGRPYSRAQLEREVRAAGLEPVAWTRALYAPPLRQTVAAAELIEAVGARLWPTLSGLVLLEAGKTGFAPVAPAKRVRVHRPMLAPVAQPVSALGPAHSHAPGTAHSHAPGPTHGHALGAATLCGHSGTITAALEPARR